MNWKQSKNNYFVLKIFQKKIINLMLYLREQFHTISPTKKTFNPVSRKLWMLHNLLYLNIFLGFFISFRKQKWIHFFVIVCSILLHSPHVKCLWLNTLICSINKRKCLFSFVCDLIHSYLHTYKSKVERKTFCSLPLQRSLWILQKNNSFFKHATIVGFHFTIFF